MDVIVGEFNKFAARHREYAGEAGADLDDLIETLRSARADMSAEQDGAARKKSLVLLAAQVKSKAARLTDSAKDVAGSLGKCGKAIDKKFSGNDLDWHPRAFEGKAPIIHQLVGEHFIREGHVALAHTFQREAGLESLETSDVHFQELNRLVSSLRARDLGPALAWAVDKRFDLNRIDSDLEFVLHKLRFLQLVGDAGAGAGSVAKNARVLDAVAYARENLAQFPEQAQDIQALLCSLVLSPTARASPTLPAAYRALESPDVLWSDAERQFARDFCALLGLSPDSPLFTAAMVGTTALPTIAKMASIMKDTKNEWTSVHELPVEVPLLPRHQFHSIFTCPVSREQGTEDNPPKMLPCGHTICNESLRKLSRNFTARFKCPYCPCDAMAAQCLRVYL
ncbi:hypothetical protein H9P43_007045 [Blastocladiella emersonii ATCC 22665]|nr:hypothetical protein H9P43_007045 [Blastocladiella emersonii ATCC 22665]